MTQTVAMVSGTAWYLWNFRRNVIRAFVAQGWKVCLLAGQDEWSGNLRAMQGVTIQDWPVALDGSNPVTEYATFRHVSRFLKQTKPGIVFNSGIKANVYGGIAARRLKLRYVNNISGLGMRMRQGDTKARLLARLYAYGSARADALLIQNDGDLAFLQAHGLPEDVPTHRTMGSGVDLAHFQAEPFPDAGPRHLLFVGRLQMDKGVGDLMRAYERCHDVKLTVVGDTTHANAGAVTNEVLADWKANSGADFVGRQSDVRPYLAACHALVMPSQGGEGMPKVVLEAAATGRPTIVSDIDGCRDTIAPGDTGWLVRPQDPDDLARAIQTFADLPEAELQRMATAARARAEHLFSDATIADICIELAEGAHNFS